MKIKTMLIEINLLHILILQHSDFNEDTTNESASMAYSNVYVYWQRKRPWRKCSRYETG